MSNLNNVDLNQDNKVANSLVTKKIIGVVIMAIIILIIIAIPIISTLKKEAKDTLGVCQVAVSNVYYSSGDIDSLEELLSILKKRIQKATKYETLLAKDERMDLKACREFYENFPKEEICDKFIEYQDLKRCIQAYRLAVDKLIDYTGKETLRIELLQVLLEYQSIEYDAVARLASILECNTDYIQVKKLSIVQAYEKINEINCNMYTISDDDYDKNELSNYRCTIFGLDFGDADSVEEILDYLEYNELILYVSGDGESHNLPDAIILKETEDLVQSLSLVEHLGKHVPKHLDNIEQNDSMGNVDDGLSSKDVNKKDGSSLEELIVGEWHLTEECLNVNQAHYPEERILKFNENGTWNNYEKSTYVISGDLIIMDRENWLHQYTYTVSIEDDILKLEYPGDEPLYFERQ